MAQLYLPLTWRIEFLLRNKKINIPHVYCERKFVSLLFLIFISPLYSFLLISLVFCTRIANVRIVFKFINLISRTYNVLLLEDEFLIFKKFCYKSVGKRVRKILSTCKGLTFLSNLSRMNRIQSKFYVRNETHGARNNHRKQRWIRRGKSDFGRASWS